VARLHQWGAAASGELLRDMEVGQRGPEGRGLPAGGRGGDRRAEHQQLLQLLRRAVCREQLCGPHQEIGQDTHRHTHTHT